jgi:D-3-phosphoglycerate dehydrogenase
MNAPDGNTMTTAEHTLALLLALARQVPQAHASLRGGKWERKKFVGVELRGKTLGVVGLGRIGRVVASRARGFEMKVLAFDPFIAPEQARDMELELAPLEEVCARADFITVHTPLTAETRGIIGAREIASMKPDVRIINCARGGLIDERALYDALKEGRVAGAAAADKSVVAIRLRDHDAAPRRFDEGSAGGRGRNGRRADARLLSDGRVARRGERSRARRT